MDEDKQLKLTQEECFLLLTGARLFDKLVAGVTIHAEQKDELIREIIDKLNQHVSQQMQAMSNELADAIVDSVLGCEDMEDGELEELELAYLESDIDELWGHEFFNDPHVRQLSIDGLGLDDKKNDIQANFAGSESDWPPFHDEPPFSNEERKFRERISEETDSYDPMFPDLSRNEDNQPARSGKSFKAQCERYLSEETFAYPMYSVDDKLPVLEKALLRHRSVEANYYSIDRETVDKITLNPLVILQEDSMWLVVAYCHERDDLFIFR
ncbi:MAG: WYL domain-containing protein, partial [Candidatus Obscuribacterales bacterium]|nr:WYL domain-containing protein [Candidatus Obscuribacterales bacterium]